MKTKRTIRVIIYDYRDKIAFNRTYKAVNYRDAIAKMERYNPTIKANMKRFIYNHIECEEIK